MGEYKNKSVDPKPAKKPAFLLPYRLTESYIITTAHRRVGIYGERFVDVIVQAARLEDTKAEYMSGGIISLSAESDGARTITFSMKRLMSNALDTNYGEAEEALRKMEAVFFEYREDGVWRSRALVTDPQIDEVNHIGSIRVPSEIWKAVKNRDEGFRIFDPQVGLKVSTEYAYRLYKLIIGQKTPLTFMLADLRGMLDIGDKYKRLADFQNRVLDSARDELIKNADWYFDYKLGISTAASQRSKRGRPAYDKITFYAKVNDRNKIVPSMQALADKYYHGDIVTLLPDKLLSYLKQKYQFSEKEIRNSRVIAQAYHTMRSKGEDMLAFLLDNTIRIDSAKNKKAYLVKMVKTHVAEKYGVVFGKPSPSVNTAERSSNKNRDSISLGDLIDR